MIKLIEQKMIEDNTLGIGEWDHNDVLEIRGIRKLVADIFWQLKKDYKYLSVNTHEYSNLTYDVGMIVGYLRSINEKKLASKIYDKFMDN